MKVQRRKGSRAKIVVPIAAMGDIAFLLIIFFMIASQFIQQAHVDLDKPTSPEVKKLENADITVSLDEDGQLWLNGDECKIDQLESRVSSLMEKKDAEYVYIEVHNELVRSQYERVFVEVSSAGAKIAMIGEKTEEK